MINTRASKSGTYMVGHGSHLHSDTTLGLLENTSEVKVAQS